ncbi:hypothetical protein [Niastella populi]|uniref:Uncharacterized protein n=1 Tax=Niastella populi TaxID=550983 RepID=A0A1V9FDW0_9BACT|nr:hypothetical protein [Niastella populi]OQP56554.1 hypothetical protein A4R26_05170 [Niastella populi]
MAKLDGTIQFTGSLQNLSAYKMRGSDKLILRKKGGPTKKQVKHSPNFELTRRNNMEFGGRAISAAFIKRVLHPLLFLADHNITAPFNALLRAIQKMDTESDYGKRHIMLTRQPRLLEGYTLNRTFLFETIVRTPVICHLQEEEIYIDLPALEPGINFMAPGNFAVYKFIAVAGLAPDIYYTEHGYQPGVRDGYFFNHTESDWLPVNASAPARRLTLEAPLNKPADCSTVIALGVAFGVINGMEIKPVKYVGAAKVLMMA